MTLPIKKHLHFIGISGTAMASLARAFKVAGFKITGSEAEHVFPPMSEYLKKNKIKYYSPFSREKLDKIVRHKTTGSFVPRICSGLRMTLPLEIVIGNAHYSDQNPEVVYARENKIELEHFPRLIEKYLIKKNSVVVAGTYGKTSATAMLAWLLDKVGKKPNYMLGGIPINWGHGARLTNTNWSVVEGDEYPAASPWDFSPKFNFYHPKFLIISSAGWDHMDIFKTKKSYVDVFKKLVARMPKNGLIVAKLDGENLKEVLKSAKCRVVFYAGCHSEQAESCISTTKPRDPVYFVDDVRVKGKITEFNLKKYTPCNVILAKARISTTDNKTQDSRLRGNDNIIIGKFQTQLLGGFNLENWAAALTMAIELGVPIKILQKAVADFRGVKRRLEIRAVENGVIIIDDFAHNPSKARQSMIALKKHFPNKKIFIIFEPNRGGRSIKCLKLYNNIFKSAEKIFIPKLSEYKKKKGVIDVSGEELAQYLRKTHTNVVYERNNEKILSWFKSHVKSDAVIAFLGSRDFGGMIEKVIKSCNKWSPCLHLKQVNQR